MTKKRALFLGRLGIIALILALTLPLSAALAAPADAQAVTATPTTNLRIRSGPGTNFSHIGLVPQGTVLTVQGRNDASNWLYIEYQGTTGWIAAWYTNVGGNLASVPVTGQSGVEAPGQDTGVRATPTVTLYIRSGPNTTYSHVGLASANVALPVLSRTADS
ncbi:MAG TPA: SH3 domain-containing protein, partial [Aggregatilineales bacterium]|nr:SH3 domain-containing protein [Aggregatilineales bacterium]